MSSCRVLFLILLITGGRPVVDTTDKTGVKLNFSYEIYDVDVDQWVDVDSQPQPTKPSLTENHLVWIDHGDSFMEQLESSPDPYRIILKPTYKLMAYHIPSKKTFQVNSDEYGAVAGFTQRITSDDDAIYYTIDRLDDDQINPMLVKTRPTGLEILNKCV